MSRILMVTSEASPFAKTGGLADVLGALPAALAKIGEEVVVVLPRYRSAVIGSSERIWNAMPITIGRRSYSIAIDQVELNGVRYLFIDCPELYGREGVYNEGGIDYPDNHIRFAVLNLAAIGIARSIFRPHIFHGHDWPGALLGMYCKEIFAGDPTFYGTKTVLTIHNLGYQGNFPSSVLGDLGLGASTYHSEGLEFWGRVSFLKAGIVWSDAITTVSPTYAREIQTPAYGFGMDGLLRARAERVVGILNGADYTEWNPETDEYIGVPYSAADLTGKQHARRYLLESMGLPEVEGRAIAGVVSRFAHQKGMDFIGDIAGELAAENMALVMLGSGEPALEDQFRSLARAYPENIAVEIGYDHALSHRIMAGADLFLMPSRYEPCGLSQIYGLRYGTVPVVRATGGLDDTVDASVGFKFRDESGAVLLNTIRDAVAVWQDTPKWERMMREGMSRDFSWEASARQYRDLYTGLRR